MTDTTNTASQVKIVPESVPQVAPVVPAAPGPSSSIWTAAFWKGAAERMVKTFIQTFIPTLIVGLGITDGASFNVFGVDWSTALVGALGIALGATFLSLCTSIGNADFTAGK
jgi:hypothetical protein